VNRGRDRAEPLVELLNDKTNAKAEFAPWSQGYRAPGDADIVVNATSIGLYPDIDGRLDLDVDSLGPSMVAADLIPNPPRTLFLRGAAERGCRTLDGLGMLVNQGVIGIKYWTDVDVDPTVMRGELAKVLGV
jgi:shikimate dehydrogenase